MEYNHDGCYDEPDGLYTVRNDAVNASGNISYAGAADGHPDGFYGSKCGDTVRNDAAVRFSPHEYGAGCEYCADTDDGHSDSGTNRSNTVTVDHHDNAEPDSGAHHINHERNTFYRNKWNEQYCFDSAVRNESACGGSAKRM